MITLKNLTWSDMFSYGANNSISFDQEPLVQIVGPNGSGKSSIPSILEETLFNKNSKGIKKGDIVNRSLSTNKYSNGLTFSIDEDEYEIKIKRTGATQKVSLLKNGCDISSHTATETFKQVETLLGIDQKNFSQYVYQSGTNSLQFLTATDTNRKKFLIDLLNLDKYVRAFELLKVTHKSVGDSLLSVKAKRDTVKGFIDKYSKVPLIDHDILPLPNPLDKELLDKRGVLIQTLSTIEGRNKAISNNNLYIKSRNSISQEDLVGLPTIDTSKYSTELAELNASIRQEQASISKYSKLVGKCPTCSQDIPESMGKTHLDVHNSNLVNLRSRVVEVEKTINYAETYNREATRKDKLIGEFERLTALIDTNLPTEPHDAEDLSNQIDIINMAEGIYKTELKRISEANNAASAINSKNQSLREQLLEFSQELSGLESSIAELEKQHSNFEILKKVFSTNGLIAYKLESSVKALEVLVNEYLEELSDGRFQISFEVSNDKLNVIIGDNGDSIDIAALSAGELARVNTATLLAIRKLMTGKSKINLLFLDEVIDTLDTNGKEKLIEVLLKEGTLNTFLVSHGYSHPLLKKIMAVKEDGISRLEDG